MTPSRSRSGIIPAAAWTHAQTVLGAYDGIVGTGMRKEQSGEPGCPAGGSTGAARAGGKNRGAARIICGSSPLDFGEIVFFDVYSPEA